MEVGDQIATARRYASPALSQEQLAEALKVSRSMVAAWETGRVIPRPETIERIAEITGVETSWFGSEASGPPTMRGTIGIPRPMPLSATLPMPRTTAPLPYAGTVPASTEWGDPLEVQDKREVDAGLYAPRRFLATVVGDSCWPALHQGDLCVFEQDVAPRSGVIVLAQRKGDHTCTVKLLEVDDRGRPHLVPINPAYEAPPDDPGWGVVARLVAVIRYVDGTERRWYNQAGVRPAQLT